MMVTMIMMQLLLVDLVDIGLMDESDIGERLRLDATVTRLSETISSGLEIRYTWEQTTTVSQV